MSSALDQFERQLVAASRQLHTANDTPAATTSATDRPPVPSMRRRRRWPLPPKRLMLSLAAAGLVAGGVAAASSLLGSPQRLADGHLNCFTATHGTDSLRYDFHRHLLAAGGATPNGQPPISFCRMIYRLEHSRLNGSPTGPAVARLPLIACQQNATTVGVFVSTGRPDQCHNTGAQPLPRAYASARARLRKLQRALLAVQDKHDCTSVDSIAQQARAVLSRLGFNGWRVIVPPPGKRWLFGYQHPTGTGGTCGTILNAPPPSTQIAMYPHSQTVVVSVLPPRSIDLTINRVLARLGTASSQRCYTRSSIRPLARRLLANTKLQPRFAFIARPPGETYQPAAAERRYDQGCVHLDLGIAGNNNRFIDIVFNARGAPRRLDGPVFPPTSSFHP